MRKRKLRRSCPTQCLKDGGQGMHIPKRKSVMSVKDFTEGDRKLCGWFLGVDTGEL